MKKTPPLIALVTIIVTLVIGVLVSTGWFTHTVFFKAIIPGQVEMKLNVAISFVLSSIVLLHTYFSKNKKRNYLISSMAALVAIIGLLTIIEYAFGLNLGIDELFVKDTYPTTASYFSGRMSIIAAINLLFIGSGLLLMNREKTATYQFFYLSGIVVLVLLMLVGLNFITELPRLVQLPVNSAVGFVTLCTAIYLSQPMLQDKISFERKLSIGFASLVVLIAAISILTYYYVRNYTVTNQLQQNTGFISLNRSLYIFIALSVVLITIILFSIRKNIAANRELSKNEHDFQLLVGSVKDYAIFLLDKDGLVTTWNSGAERIKGYTAEEIIGRHFEIFYTKEEKQLGEPKKNLQLALKYGHYETENWRLRKDGSTFYANIVFTALMDKDGKLYGYAKVTKDITEKKKSEERVNFLASIADNIQDPVISSDLNYVITRWNSAAEQLLEWKSEETIGKTTAEILQTYYPTESREQILASFRENGFWQGEVIFYTKSGVPVNVLTTVSHLKDSAGNITGFLILVRDITKRKNDELALSKLNTELEQRVQERTEELNKSEKQFRALIENSDDIISMIDENMIPFYRTPSAERFTGYTFADRIMGVKMDQVHPDDIEKVKSCLGQIRLHPGKPIAVTYRLKHKMGHWIWLEGTFMNLFHEPAVGAIVANMREVTQRKAAEEATIKNEEKYRTLIESMTEAFVAFDKNMCYTYVNKIMGEVSALNPAEMTGKRMDEVFPELVGSPFYKACQKALSEQQNNSIIEYFPRFDRWFEQNIYATPDGISVFSRDITDKKKAEEEILALNAGLEEKVVKRTAELQIVNNELEAFTYSVSHDLRAPLRAILGYTAILEEEHANKLDDESKRLTFIIKKNALKMGHLIDDLLEFSRMGKQGISKTTINTQVLIEEILEELNELKERGSQIEWIIHSLPAMHADISIIRQVWINLISNAIKYSAKNQAPRIEIGGYEDQGHPVFFVKDNGVGFDMKYANKLFKIFQRLHSPKEFDGTGVGLALVERIVAKHGGKVWAESEVDKGAAFYFSV